MKFALLYFFIFLLLIQENEGQTVCSGISIPFDLTGNYCGVSGNINFFHNTSSILMLAGFSNVTKDNFNGDLCIINSNRLSISTNIDQCSEFDPGDYIGNFTINLALCDAPYEIFQNFSIYYDRYGLYPGNWTCTNAIDCNHIPGTPTSLSISVTPSTSPSSYIPCQSWIHFGADDSNTLNPNGYATQLSFISTAIGAINHPERIQVFGVYAETISWNSGLSIPQIQSAVMTIPQEGTYRLRLEFDDLLTGLQNVQVNNTPVGALIFISDTSDEALLNANNSFAQIPSSIRITFVLLGPNSDQNKLTQFSNNFITWRDLSQPQPENWNNLLAYGCAVTTQTTPSTTAVTETTSAQSTSSVPYIPCQSWIFFGVDDSDVLTNNSFLTQLNFISSAIGNINHPERIAAFGSYNGGALWYSGLTIEQIQQNVTGMYQCGVYNLTQHLYDIIWANFNNPQPNSAPIGASIFISDTSDLALQGAYHLFNGSSILQSIRITFVLLGANPDQNKLTNFSSNFISWRNLSQPQPDNWNNLYGPAYGCSKSNSTAITTGTFTMITSTTNTTINTGTTSIPHLPCETWISFSYDDSITLQSSDYRNQILFIANAIGSINYPDRLRINGEFTSVVSWNSGQTISQMQTKIDSSQQTSNPYSLLLEVSGLLTDAVALGNITTWPIGVLIFISDTSDAAIENAQIYFSQFPPNVRITFVMLGSNVDSSKLTQFSSNFIYWPDLSQPQPDYWNSSFFNAYGCDATTRAMRIKDSVQYTSRTLRKSQTKLNKNMPTAKLSIDNYCFSNSQPTSIFTIPTTSYNNGIPSTPKPNEIIPPLPVLNCSDPDNSYIIDQTCRINDTSNPITIDQLINSTSAHIQEKIRNDNFTAENVHDTGIFLYNTVTTVDNLTTDSAHKFLDITNSVVVQPLNTLAAANNITSDSLLWYPSSLPKVIALTKQDLNYSKPDSNILVHSFTLNDSFCVNSENSREICYSSTSQVPSGSKDAEFCTTFNPNALCKNAEKAFLILWKSLSFFALVKNNTMGIINGLGNPQSSDSPTTFDTADKCSDGTYYKNNYGSNVGGTYPNGDSVGTGSFIWVKRRDDENDLHISKYKLAKFIGTSFEDSGTKVTKSNQHYTSQCPEGMCTIVVEGNPTEPIVCSSGAKTTTAVITGFGIFLAVIGVCAVIVQSDAIPIVGRVLKVFFSIFGDKNLPLRLKFFACCYNITFMIYSFYSIFISQQTISDTSKNWCTVFAIVGYVLYISAVFLSVIMLILTLDALGCWKPVLKNIFYIFTGNKRNYIPFIHSYGIPLIITGIFAVTLTSFFKRNDGYCWIRPDYAILALWFPIILLFLTIPFYIILFARKWPNLGLSKLIYSFLTISEELEAYEEEKKKREDQEKQEKLKEFTEKLFGKQSANDQNDNEDGKAEDKKFVLTNTTLALLLIPQIFLAIPLIAENLALYYSQLTGWHYLFLFTQALQLIVINGIDWLESLPEKLEFVKAGFDAIKGKPQKEESDESKWGKNN